MKRTLMHEWVKDLVYNKLNYKKCKKCNCEHYYDSGFKRYVFMTARGEVLYRTPRCEPK
jgi:hypothetical protein